MSFPALRARSVRALLGTTTFLAVCVVPVLASAAPPEKGFEDLDQEVFGDLEREPTPTIEELTTDPRKRGLPRRHRFRLALHSHWIRLSEAVSEERSVRFHHAPLMIDVAYQVQFAKLLAVRPALAAGYNVANTRHAMPLAIEPQLYFGIQSKVVGFMAGYAFLLTQPATPDASDGRTRSLPEPAILNNHIIRAELSFSTRIDRSALTFGVGVGAVKSRLLHISRDENRWRPILNFSFGAYFDGSIMRERRARKGLPPKRPKPRRSRRSRR